MLVYGQQCPVKATHFNDLEFKVMRTQSAFPYREFAVRSASIREVNGSKKGRSDNGRQRHHYFLKTMPNSEFSFQEMITSHDT